MYSYNPYYETYLAHYGVKGMKWGVRKESSSSGSVKKKKIELTDKQKKALKIALTVTGAILIANTARKIDHEYFDKVLKKGSKISTVQFRPTSSSDKFYGATNALDKNKYAGFLPAQNAIKNKSIKYAKTNRITRVVDSDIKIPSYNKSKRLFKGMYKNDSEFRDAVKSGILNKDNEAFYNTPKAKRLLLSAKKEVNKSRPNYNKIHDAFNINMVTSNEKEKAANSKFFNKMKDIGYGAIRDVNDEKYSTYRTKSPLIIFNDKKVANTRIKSIKKQKPVESFIRATIAIPLSVL